MKNNKLILTIIFLIISFGCSPDNGGISGTGGPRLPPAESMGVINLPNDTFDKKRYKGLKLTSHYDHANLLYQKMSTSVFNEMNLQSKLFSSVYEVKPIENEPNEYQWVTDETSVAEVKNVNLFGKKTNTQMEWLMNILTINDIEDSVLEGFSTLNNMNGSWDIYKTKGVKILEIVWEKKNSVFEVTYTNVSNNEHHGDSIVLRIESKNVYMQYTDVSHSETIILKWNVATQAGSVKDPNFIDGQERFWNSNLENINDTDNF